MSDAERSALSMLIGRLDTPSPIRPSGAIDLNHNTRLVALGLTMTYIVVLFQFKIGESPTSTRL